MIIYSLYLQQQVKALRLMLQSVIKYNPISIYSIHPVLFIKDAIQEHHTGRRLLHNLYLMESFDMRVLFEYLQNKMMYSVRIQSLVNEILSEFHKLNRNHILHFAFAMQCIIYVNLYPQLIISCSNFVYSDYTTCCKGGRYC